MYMERYMKPHKWSYLREQVNQSNSSRQQNGIFKITSAIERPRDVFVWIINDEKNNNQEKIRFCLILLVWRMIKHLNLVN